MPLSSLFFIPHVRKGQGDPRGATLGPGVFA